MPPTSPHLFQPSRVNVAFALQETVSVDNKSLLDVSNVLPAGEESSGGDGRDNVHPVSECRPTRPSCLHLFHLLARYRGLYASRVVRYFADDTPLYYLQAGEIDPSTKKPKEREEEEDKKAKSGESHGEDQPLTDSCHNPPFVSISILTLVDSEKASDGKTDGESPAKDHGPELQASKAEPGRKPKFRKVNKPNKVKRLEIASTMLALDETSLAKECTRLRLPVDWLAIPKDKNEAGGIADLRKERGPRVTDPHANSGRPEYHNASSMKTLPLEGMGVWKFTVCMATERERGMAKLPENAHTDLSFSSSPSIIAVESRGVSSMGSNSVLVRYLWYLNNLMLDRGLTVAIPSDQEARSIFLHEKQC
ncbi:hypothetical protein PIIN_06927 [Serendipita indica DSM 11827]|uniref:Uncharacterized protein n=1 Tax=Serendipita indica (strain DSM 11827) TaxID=1109443 RepID=G4TNS9_SERID|nr:hypothetical protein PIIN_06927 [Serendipita indica DSM 11827]